MRPDGISSNPAARYLSFCVMLLSPSRPHPLTWAVGARVLVANGFQRLECEVTRSLYTLYLRSSYCHICEFNERVLLEALEPCLECVRHIVISSMIVPNFCKPCVQEFLEFVFHKPI